MRRTNILIPVILACAAIALAMGGARLSGQSLQATQPPNKKSLKIVPIEQSKPNSGAQMFKDYCASCHGVDGSGDGPAVAFLKTPPPDLRLMAQRNNGKYPALHVKVILTQGPDSTRAHGDLHMPTWGSLFRSSHYGSPELRIANLTTFIESIQDK